MARSQAKPNELVDEDYVRTLTSSSLGFLEDAKQRVEKHAMFQVPPERLFALIADQSTWPSWCADCTAVAWTSAERECVGATRRATFRFGTFEERMLAWQPEPDDDGDRLIAFTVEQASLPGIVRVVEEWRVEGDDPDDDEFDPHASFLFWTMALETNSIGKLAWPAVRAVIGSAFERSVRNLERTLRGA